jgi:hypothetical protein
MGAGVKRVPVKMDIEGGTRHIRLISRDAYSATRAGHRRPFFVRPPLNGG